MTQGHRRNYTTLTDVTDPDDRRAQMVQFAPGGAKIREDAQQTLRELEGEMEAILGKADAAGLRSALAKFP